uniref:NADH-ubiquinone oxidoreductase chain 3 n=2 Tax=Perga condei TaxID=32411 RepID=Q5EQN8_9HYME|nr:NADH dehydrogenase subunit 3 [Perga condei]
MILIMYMSMLTLFISLLIMMLASLISKKSFYDREKSSPFECGFDPKTHARLPFSIHFFLIALIFVIFDVEITLILPMIKSMYMSNIFTWSNSVMLFLTILLLGLYYEWNYGALNWFN